MPSESKTQSKAWYRFSALNLLEHGVTRGADILITLSIVWGFSTERFSILAASQAIVAPLLLFFPPVYVLYREFSGWKGRSPDVLASHLWILRRFGWGLGQFAVGLSLLAAMVAPFGESYWTRFWALLWGFALTAGINVFAPDRELLRLELKMRALNGVTLYQKTTALVGTLIVVFYFPGRIDLLAIVAVGSVISTAWISRRLAIRVLRESGASDPAIYGHSGPPVLATLIDLFGKFSIWNHLSGVIWNWVQTMDLFFLGIFRVPALQLGLYSVALKISNLSLALPTALGNVFAVWVGRRHGSVKEGVAEERAKLLRYSLFLAGGCLVQAICLYAVAPVLIRLLSHGRWDLEQQKEILGWLGWIISGSALFAAGFLLNWWLTLRANVSRLLWRVYFPLLVGGISIYGVTARWLGPDGTAPANVTIGLLYVLLVSFFFRQFHRSGESRGFNSDEVNPTGAIL